MFCAVGNTDATVEKVLFLNGGQG